MNYARGLVERAGLAISGTGRAKAGTAVMPSPTLKLKSGSPNLTDTDINRSPRPHARSDMVQARLYSCAKAVATLRRCAIYGRAIKWIRFKQGRSTAPRPLRRPLRYSGSSLLSAR